MGLPPNDLLANDIPLIEKNSPKKIQKSMKLSKNVSNNLTKLEKTPKLEKDFINTANSNKIFENDSLSESDQSEKEIGKLVVKILSNFID